MSGTVTKALYDGASLWVYNNSANVGRIDPQTGKEFSSTPASTPNDMAFDSAFVLGGIGV